MTCPITPRRVRRVLPETKMSLAHVLTAISSTAAGPRRHRRSISKAALRLVESPLSSHTPPPHVRRNQNFAAHQRGRGERVQPGRAKWVCPTLSRPELPPAAAPVDGPRDTDAGLDYRTCRLCSRAALRVNRAGRRHRRCRRQSPLVHRQSESAWPSLYSGIPWDAIPSRPASWPWTVSDFLADVPVWYAGARWPVAGPRECGRPGATRSRAASRRRVRNGPHGPCGPYPIRCAVVAGSCGVLPLQCRTCSDTHFFLYRRSRPHLPRRSGRLSAGQPRFDGQRDRQRQDDFNRVLGPVRTRACDVRRREPRVEGSHVPVWRAGANAATLLQTDADLLIGNLAVPKGTYSLYVNLTNMEAWELIVNKETGSGGSPTTRARTSAGSR